MDIGYDQLLHFYIEEKTLQSDTCILKCLWAEICLLEPHILLSEVNSNVLVNYRSAISKFIEHLAASLRDTRILNHNLKRQLEIVKYCI